MLPPDTQTRVFKKADCDGIELAERIALYAIVTKHARAEAVLQGLAKGLSAAASKLVKEAASWPSAKRQARITVEFGTRGDQHERLAELMAEAHPVLRLAMCAAMLPQQQARFPALAGKDFRQLPGRTAFAARLVREASR